MRLRTLVLIYGVMVDQVPFGAKVQDIAPQKLAPFKDIHRHESVRKTKNKKTRSGHSLITSVSVTLTFFAEHHLSRKSLTIITVTLLSLIIGRVSAELITLALDNARPHKFISIV